jgi:hypothetical protein
VTAAAGEPGRGRGGKKSSYDSYDRHGKESVHGQVRVVFSSGDVYVIRQHYAPRYRHLPPGLRKKLASTGRLPPGWQRKIRPFPVVLEHRLPVLPRGYYRGVYDDHAVIYYPRRGVIVDAAVIF